MPICEQDVCVSDHPARRRELRHLTADWAKLPYDVSGRISSRIVDKVAGVNRVAYDITSKLPAKIKWE